jgi:hypothetical protein
MSRFKLSSEVAQERALADPDRGAARTTRGPMSDTAMTILAASTRWMRDDWRNR